MAKDTRRPRSAAQPQKSERDRGIDDLLTRLKNSGPDPVLRKRIEEFEKGRLASR